MGVTHDTFAIRRAAVIVIGTGKGNRHGKAEKRQTKKSEGNLGEVVTCTRTGTLDLWRCTNPPTKGAPSSGEGRLPLR